MYSTIFHFFLFLPTVFFSSRVSPQPSAYPPTSASPSDREQPRPRSRSKRRHQHDELFISLFLSSLSSRHDESFVPHSSHARKAKSCFPPLSLTLYTRLSTALFHHTPLLLAIDCSTLLRRLLLLFRSIPVQLLLRHNRLSALTFGGP